MILEDDREMRDFTLEYDESLGFDDFVVSPDTDDSYDSPSDDSDGNPGNVDSNDSHSIDNMNHSPDSVDLNGFHGSVDSFVSPGSADSDDSPGIVDSSDYPDSYESPGSVDSAGSHGSNDSNNSPGSIDSKASDISDETILNEETYIYGDDPEIPYETIRHESEIDIGGIPVAEQLVSHAKLFIEEILTMPLVLENPFILKVGKRLIRTVDVIGSIVDIESKEGVNVYTLCDGTGEIQCACFTPPPVLESPTLKETFSGTALAQRLDALLEEYEKKGSVLPVGTVLRVQGSLNVENGIRHIIAKFFDCIERPIEMFYKFAECVNVSSLYDQPSILSRNMNKSPGNPVLIITDYNSDCDPDPDPECDLDPESESESEFEPKFDPFESDYDPESEPKFNAESNTQSETVPEPEYDPGFDPELDYYEWSHKWIDSMQE